VENRNLLNARAEYERIKKLQEQRKDRNPRKKQATMHDTDTKKTVYEYLPVWCVCIIFIPILTAYYHFSRICHPE
jgi:hypothetical protein